MPRALLILVIVFAWLLPSGGGGRIARELGAVAHHAGDSCCVQIEIESCCDEETSKPVELVCPVSQGECECTVAPNNRPTPMPKAPHPGLGIDLQLVLLQGRQEIVRVALAPSTTRPNLGLLSLVRGRTHNETQALLGVWQT